MFASLHFQTRAMNMTGFFLGKHGISFQELIRIMEGTKVVILAKTEKFWIRYYSHILPKSKFSRHLVCCTANNTLHHRKIFSGKRILNYGPPIF